METKHLHGNKFGIRDNSSPRMHCVCRRHIGRVPSHFLETTTRSHTDSESCQFSEVRQQKEKLNIIRLQYLLPRDLCQGCAKKQQHHNYINLSLIPMQGEIMKQIDATS